MAKILITGANGQLGSELRNLLDERGIAYDAFDSKQMDITDQAVVNEKISALNPEVIYHCAAYTAVDNAEAVAKDLNWQVNADGTRNVAEVAKKVGAKMVYISTDYVFDGTNEGEYEVDAPTNPRNEYGKAKLAGEKAIQEILTDYYIIRTSWVFGKYGKNFVYTMLRLAKDHDQLFGTYQLSNENSCSWYEFATEILKDKDVEVSPVDSSAYPAKAYRPRHSVMSLKKAEDTGFEIVDWQTALS